LIGSSEVTSRPSRSGVFLLVGVSLVQMLPAWRGAGLWILIAVLGLTAVLVATLMEQSRSAVR